MSCEETPTTRAEEATTHAEEATKCAEEATKRAELREFLKHSAEHRTQIKKDRETLSREQLERVKYETSDHVDRGARKRRLYGAHAEEVEMVEARLSLRYETYCDENQPVLWPVLPLKL